ncbi:MAG: ribonuclease P protein component [Mycoplasmataceae bacterium]|jgi:ribonuclease P protein component|nr:ribonuclease P protein component [Mycoplasmataceae bacterium]
MKNNIISLKDEHSFKNILSSRLSFSNSSYRICYIPNRLKTLQYGIAVGKKTFRTAVLRNKIKRQIRMFLVKLPTIKCVDIVILVREGYLKNTFLENSKLFLDLYNNIR